MPLPMILRHRLPLLGHIVGPKPAIWRPCQPPRYQSHCCVLAMWVVQQLGILPANNKQRFFLLSYDERIRGLATFQIATLCTSNKVQARHKPHVAPYQTGRTELRSTTQDSRPTLPSTNKTWHSLHNSRDLLSKFPLPRHSLSVVQRTGASPVSLERERCEVGSLGIPCRQRLHRRLTGGPAAAVPRRRVIDPLVRRP
ncbi:unnamed protein product, partial [Ectocarpus sp. 12 AP-2014]